MPRKQTKSAFTAAHGYPALPWTAEPPRAEGWWWWVQGKWDNEQPAVVRVWMKADLRTSDAPRKMHMQWNGGHKERVCEEVGGWWLGPVEQPKTPWAETPDNSMICGKDDNAVEN